MPNIVHRVFASLGGEDSNPGRWCDAVLAVCKEPFLDLFKKKHDTDAKLSRDTRSAGFVVVTKEAKSGQGR